MFSSFYKKSEIRIADKDIADVVSVRYSKRARKMSLRLDPKASMVVLTVPHRGSPVRALEFVLSHKQWILDRVAKLPSPIQFKEGSILSILGKDRKIIQVQHDKKRTSIELTDTELKVYTNLVDPSLRVKRWLKDYARETLSDTSHKKCSLLPEGYVVKNVSIRDTKSRWGSCSDDGRLSFSWRLIFASPEAFDYVVSHEVAHLVHMNHSKAFWNLCSSLCSDYKSGRAWMDKNGNTLMRFGQNS